MTGGAVTGLVNGTAPLDERLSSRVPLLGSGDEGYEIPDVCSMKAEGIIAGS